MNEAEEKNGETREQLIDDALHLYTAKLQRENAEDKSWIRQPNNFISVVAIIISLMSVAYGYIKDYHDGIDKDLQSLSSVVEDLTKVDTDAVTAATSNVDQAVSSNVVPILNNRRIALLAEADRLITRLGKLAPRAQLAVLGPEYYKINDYQKAAKYFLLLGNDKSEAPTLRLNAWRSLGVMYFHEGQDFYDRGRDAYRNAAQVFQNPTDIGSLALVIGVYEQWAISELKISNFSGALQQFENARQLATKLPCPTLRPKSLTGIDKKIQQTIQQFQTKDPNGAKQAIPALTPTAGDSAC